MVLLGLLLAAVAIVVGVGLALQPGGEVTTVHFFGLNLPNLNGRTLILIGVAVGILFMLGLMLIRSGIAAAGRRRRERKALKAQAAEAKRDAVDAREHEAASRHEAEHHDGERESPAREAARRQEENASWERAEAARREEAARQEEAALRQRADAHQPEPRYGNDRPTEPQPRYGNDAPTEPQPRYGGDPYQQEPYASDPYTTAGGHRPPEPYRGDSHTTEAYPTVDPHGDTDTFPTVDPYGERQEQRTSGTVYQSGGHGYQEPDHGGQYGQPPPTYPPSHQ